MKILIKISLVTLLLGAVSCKKYLNVVPDDVATLNSSFANSNETEAYLIGNCYSSLQQLGDVCRNPGFTASGEVIIPTDLPSNASLRGSGQDAGFNLLLGEQNVPNPLMNYWDGYNQGLNLWQAIRWCNTFLANVNLPLDLTADNKKRWIAEAKFLKAYYHYWLIRMYGPIPIADVALPVNASTTAVRQKQQSVDSCFNYVVGLINQAIPDLPPSIQNTITEDGRITQAIALAVKAEVLTTQASPLFNGNPDYAGVKGVDGTPLWSAAAVATKWQTAAAACKAAIDAATANGAALYQFVPQSGLKHMSDSTKLLLTIQGALNSSWNTEQIWTTNTTFGYQIQACPRVTTDATTVYDFWSNFSVPMGETEIFYSNNGVPINEDKTFDYSNRYTVVQGDAANQYYVSKGYNTNKGNLNREARYYADIAFDGSNWFGYGNTDDNNPNVINAVNGNASPADPISYNSTGYWPRKLVPYQTASSNSVFTSQNYYWPFMRLPSLWLLYAECLNEVEGPGSDVYQWIDKVRARVGLQGVQQAWATYSNNPSKPNTQTGLRQIIHQERRIELAFEGQAGWDLRRWKELQAVLANPFIGWTVQDKAKTMSAYYNLHTAFQPFFGLRDYLFPVQQYDLLTNPNLVQTPYW
ncbi:RagB/SusD family nutrient uptake outer membrane protein [Puia dinghuensis]|uniref:Starch-binding protein n=1 Tax=Puia dinghuensis TaxID=1792502 RepID=A0A8J2UI43_9BACT|nr:RagB/SusD family nutrient uptake outer membrane protein [Puia dinghuensis]GGB20884.1 starch-binding protein [Puia dinghuensis]